MLVGTVYRKKYFYLFIFIYMYKENKHLYIFHNYKKLENKDEDKNVIQ